MSAVIAVVPVDPLVIVTRPEVPSATVTRFDTVALVVKVRFAPAGLAAPVGYTVKDPGAFDAFAVTLSTTEAAPLAGTPPCPATVTATEPFAATGVFGAPTPVVVSS